MKDQAKITVCDKCLRATCWQGIFMCDESRDAGTVEKSIGELKELKLEHESYWRNENVNPASKGSGE